VVPPLWALKSNHLIDQLANGRALGTKSFVAGGDILHPPLELLLMADVVRCMALKMPEFCGEY
jgi:hypothetical protein